MSSTVQREGPHGQMETVINITDEGDQSEPNTHEDEQFTVCRICYDENKNENLVSPCYCIALHGIVHKSCLEKWISISGNTSCEVCQYAFKTVEYSLTIGECFRKKEYIKELCINFSAFVGLIVAWVVLTLVCGTKAVFHFLEPVKTIHTFPVGINLIFLTLIMFSVSFLWLVIFNSIFKMWLETKTETRLDFTEDIPLMPASNKA